MDKGAHATQPSAGTATAIAAAGVDARSAATAAAAAATVTAARPVIICFILVHTSSEAHST